MGIECPRCNQSGKKVKSITVKHLVTESLAEKVPDKEIYYLCMSEDCDVVYYNLDREDIFNRTEIKVPIWFKKDADPKYICYCSKVTEEEIIDAVINQGAENMNDVIKITGAMENGNCTLNNPLGRCCGSIIMETINKAIKANK
ncbi:(2Fe-2S)-binding protein [Tissierella sp. MB52-C2]|uniref:Csac_0668 family 2Fe-2S cluster-binding (seleno)protein n=1 Tax=Tissierella sp. MB52-C2 TaxID=3070999 RepID=UPI00280AFB57|nr:(2Fe-2S)-binding protein [Tissierella sp. MB52-C2]WMM24418.1 (2Fe-2S)-binding protein [Tissierella sp. MB52-C2]